MVCAQPFLATTIQAIKRSCWEGRSLPETIRRACRRDHVECGEHGSVRQHDRWRRAMIGVSCFCHYCREKAKDRGISAERAKEGYRKLQYLFRPGPKMGQRPPDGYFTTFWRTLLEYPEILSWQKLWMDSYTELRSELYGAAKSIAPEKPFGFHIQQNVTFSPFYSAGEDFTQLAKFSDFLKVATYNNAGGPRMGRLVERLEIRFFATQIPQNLLPVLLLGNMMGYHEATVPEITLNGLTSEYVYRRRSALWRTLEITRRFIRASISACRPARQARRNSR